MKNSVLSRQPFVIGLCLFAFVILGFTMVRDANARADKDQPLRVVASEVIIKPSDGKRELRLGELDELFGGLGMRIVDNSGKTRLCTGIIPGNDSQPVIHLYDASGNPRMVVELGPDGSAIISAVSPDGKPQFDIVGREGGTGLELFEDGRNRIRVLASCREVGKAHSTTGRKAQSQSGSSDRGCIRVYEADGNAHRDIP